MISKKLSKIFSLSLTIATCLPLLIVFLIVQFDIHNNLLISFVGVMSVIGGTHVFLTTYLLTDRKVIDIFRKNKFKLITIPLILATLTVLLLNNPNNSFFQISILSFMLYQIWHFTSQNIGVATFLSIAERGGPLFKNEKILLKTVRFCSCFGVLKIMMPDFMIGSSYMNLNEISIQMINYFYNFGFYLSFVIIFFAIPIISLNFIKQRSSLFFVNFIACTFFPLSMYFTSNYMIGIGAFAISHGIQYVIILFFKRANSTPLNINKLLFKKIYILYFFIIALIGHYLWKILSSDIFTNSTNTFGLSLILGLTLAHFWIDQYLWRMSDTDVRNWVKDEYKFIFNYKPM